MRNVPNLLTFCRILAIPVFVILLTGGRIRAALAVFVVAGLTDSFDGLIARLTNSQTALGAYMDPLADKMLLVSAFVVLSSMGYVPFWLPVVVVTRDVLVLVGYLVLFLVTQRAMEVHPSLLSKASTFLQLVTVTWVLFVLQQPPAVVPPSAGILFASTAGVTAVSGLQYVVRGLRWYQRALAVQ